MIHELKTLPEYFEAVIKGEKLFEVRKFDRPCKTVADYSVPLATSGLKEQKNNAEEKE